MKRVSISTKKKKRNGTNERMAKSTAATATNGDQQPERAQRNLYHFIFTLNARVLRAGLTRSFDFVLPIWIKQNQQDGDFAWESVQRKSERYPSIESILIDWKQPRWIAFETLVSPISEVSHRYNRYSFPSKMGNRAYCESWNWRPKDHASAIFHCHSPARIRIRRRCRSMIFHSTLAHPSRGCGVPAGGLADTQSAM